MTDDVLLRYVSCTPKTKDVVAVVTLNRPSAANAMSYEMIQRLRQLLEQIRDNGDCRLLVLRGEGKHFSAGADLKWMESSQSLDYNGNLNEATELAQMFAALSNLTIPTFAVVHGAAYGGGVGLAACCDFAFAVEEAKFCLSEVRLGIIPAVIFPYLRRKISRGALNRLSMGGISFNAEEAEACGLVQRVIKKNELQNFLRLEIAGLLKAAPSAIARLKRLSNELDEGERDILTVTSEAIASARVGTEAINGFSAFFEGHSPTWSRTLSTDWNLDEGI